MRLEDELPRGKGFTPADFDEVVVVADLAEVESLRCLVFGEVHGASWIEVFALVAFGNFRL